MRGHNKRERGYTDREILDCIRNLEGLLDEMREAIVRQPLLAIEIARELGKKR